MGWTVLSEAIVQTVAVTLTHWYSNKAAGDFIIGVLNIALGASLF